MICQKCKKEHSGDFGSGKFCSRSCANSRVWTESDNLKKSISSKKSEKVKFANANKIRPENYLEIIKKIGLKRKQQAEKIILESDFKVLSFERLRKRVILEQKNKCNKCGLDKWLEQEIVLELDHIDGNNKNNSRENLECLCPNCHSLTPTWRGRNKHSKRKKIKDEELLLTLLKHNWNMRQSLIELDLSPKGGNYKRCHQLKKDYLKIKI